MDFEKFDQEYEALLQQAWLLHRNGIKNEEQTEQMQTIREKILAMQNDARDEIRFVTCMMFTEIELQTLAQQTEMRQKIQHQAKELIGSQYEPRTRIVAGTELWMKKLLQKHEEAELLALSRRYLEENADDAIGRSFAERNVCQLSDDTVEIIEIFHANREVGLGYRLGLAYIAAAKLPAAGVESIAEEILSRSDEIRRISDPEIPAILYGRCIRRLCNNIVENADELMVRQNLFSQKTALIGKLQQSLEELPDLPQHKAMTHYIIADMLWVIDQTDDALETMNLALEEAENATVNKAEIGEWETVKKQFQEILKQWKRELASE